MSWLDKLDRKLGRYVPNNLMVAVVAGMGIVFILDQMIGVSGYLVFNLDAVLRGQVWRLFTFIFLPPSASVIFILFSLYFYWMMGSAMEREWGSFKFLVFYLGGMVGTIIAGCLTGFATNQYVNMSLFLAFAMLYPNFQITLFFILPIKVKYLAYLDAALLLVMLVLNNWPGRIALLVSLMNIALFFWRDGKRIIDNMIRRIKWKHGMNRR